MSLIYFCNMVFMCLIWQKTKIHIPIKTGMIGWTTNTIQKYWQYSMWKKKKKRGRSSAIFN